MSAAAPTAGAAPAKKGKKKLILIGGIALVVLALAGGGAMFFLKSKAAHAEAEGDEAPAAESHSSAKVDPKHPPSFLPLDPFVVNLADKDADRYAQIGITLQVDDPKFAEDMKAYMPAVRSAILMILAHKSSAELLSSEGKEALAEEIMRESVRPMGIEIDPPEGEGKAKGDDEEKPKKKKKKKAAEHNPVQHVHFSNFIIQ